MKITNIEPIVVSYILSWIFYYKIQQRTQLLTCVFASWFSCSYFIQIFNKKGNYSLGCLLVDFVVICVFYECNICLDHGQINACPLRFISHYIV